VQDFSHNGTEKSLKVKRRRTMSLNMSKNQPSGRAKFSIVVYADSVDAELINKVCKKGFTIVRIDEKRLSAFKDVEYSEIPSTIKDLEHSGFGYSICNVMLTLGL